MMLEPIMRVAIDAPDTMAGQVIADLNARGAEIVAAESEGARVRVTAHAPMAGLGGYEEHVQALGARMREMVLNHFNHLDDGTPDTFPGEMALRA